MATIQAFDVVLLVDGDGNAGRGESREQAIEDYEARVQPLGDAAGFRFVEFAVTNVRLPEATRTTVDLGETAEEAEPVVSVG